MMALSRFETTSVCPAGRGNWSGEGEKAVSVNVGVDLPDRRVEGMAEEGIGDCGEEGAAPDDAVAKVDSSKGTGSSERSREDSGSCTRWRGEWYCYARLCRSWNEGMPSALSIQRRP